MTSETSNGRNTCGYLECSKSFNRLCFCPQFQKALDERTWVQEPELPELGLTWLLARFEDFLGSMRGGYCDQLKVKKHLRAVSFQIRLTALLTVNVVYLCSYQCIVICNKDVFIVVLHTYLFKYQ